MNEMVFYDLKQSSGLTHSLADQVARELGRRIVASTYDQGKLIEDEAEDPVVFAETTRQEVREQIDAMDFTDLFEDPPAVDLSPSEDDEELDEQPKVVLPKNVLEVDLIDEDTVGLTDDDFGELEEDDTQRMDPVEASRALAPR